MSARLFNARELARRCCARSRNQDDKAATQVAASFVLILVFRSRRYGTVAETAWLHFWPAVFTM